VEQIALRGVATKSQPIFIGNEIANRCRLATLPTLNKAIKDTI